MFILFIFDCDYHVICECNLECVWQDIIISLCTEHRSKIPSIFLKIVLHFCVFRTSPFMILLTTVYLWQYLGVSCLAGIGLMVILLPLKSILLGALRKRFQVSVHLHRYFLFKLRRKTRSVTIKFKFYLLTSFFLCRNSVIWLDSFITHITDNHPHKL